MPKLQARNPTRTMKNWPDPALVQISFIIFHQGESNRDRIDDSIQLRFISSLYLKSKFSVKLTQFTIKTFSVLLWPFPVEGGLRSL